MSIIIGTICGAIVKGAAAASIGGIATSAANAVLTATGTLAKMAPTTQKVVRVGTFVGGAWVGSKAVDKLIDTANNNGTPLVGTNRAVMIEQYNEKGVLIGTPTHKKTIIVDNLGVQDGPGT